MANVGYATLTVIPSFAGFASKLSTGMAAPMAAAATTAGATAGANASKGFTSKFQAGISRLTSGGGLLAGLGIAALGKQVIGLQADFESSMNVLRESAGVPRARMEELADFAKEMGANTVFSAGEAADAMVELAKAGLSPAQIQAGALKSTMAVAATEGLALADSATIISNAMTTFGIKGDRAVEVADALAGGSKASTASVASLSEAMSQVGGSAVDAGLSIQETVAALAAFDQEGIKGSDAGTSLKTMLSRLVPQTERAETAMEDLGLKFTDAQGQFLPLGNIAEQLQDRLSGLSDAERTTALNTIFGSDARRAAIALMHQGSEGMAKFTKATSDAGAAQRLANARMSGTAGAIEEMKGSIETAGLALGETLAPAVVTVSDGVSKLADATGSAIEVFGGLPSPIKAAATALAGFKLAQFFGLNPSAWSSSTTKAFDNVKARVQLAGDAYKESRTQIVRFGDSAVRVSSDVGRLRSSAAGLQTAFMGAGGAMKRGIGNLVGALGGPWGLAIAGGITALTIFANRNAEAAADVDALRSTLNQQTGALTKNSREWAAQKLVEEGAASAFSDLGIQADTFINGLLKQGDAASQLRNSLTTLAGGLSGYVKIGGQQVKVTDENRDAAGRLLTILDKLSPTVKQAKQEQQFLTAATDGNAKASRDAADAQSEGAKWTKTAAEAQAELRERTDQTRGAIDDQVNSVLKLIDAYNEQRDAAVGNRRDQVGLEQAFADVAKEARKGKATLDDTTKAGRDNWNALLDLADQWNTSTNEVRNSRGAWKDMREEFIQNARRMGASKDRAEALADELLKVPRRVQVRVEDKEIKNAQEEAKALKELMEDLKRLGRQRLRMLEPSSGRTAPGLTPGMAAGGKVGGMGTGDNQLRLLDPREWVINPKASAYYGDSLLNALNRMQIPKMQGGGPVATTRSSGSSGGGVNFNGPISVVAHDYGDFMQQMSRRTRKRNSGGVNF
jgi:TP901 family phage tail tape measure protein